MVGISLGGGVIFAQQVETNLREILHGYYLHVKDEWSFKELNKSLVQGNIYNHSYAQAESRITKSARDALDAIYEDIADKCEGNLDIKDVANVFSNTDEGRKLLGFLTARDGVDGLDNGSMFPKSCLKVLSCELDEVLKKEKKKLWGDTLKIRNACLWLVSKKYDHFSSIAESLGTIMDDNYGDDMFLNGDTKDGPYDLLADVRAIADVLFVHNDPPSSTHFYNMQPLGTFISNDPDQVTPYQVDQPNTDEDDPLLRVPVSNGLSPRFPKSVYYDNYSWWQGDVPFVPAIGSSEGLDPYRPPFKTEGPPSPWSISSNTLQNNICIENQEPQEPEKDILDLAEQEQKQTVNYNNKLDFGENVSVLLGGKGSSEREEQFADIFSSPDLPLLTLPEVIGEIFSKGTLQWEDMEKVKNKLVECVQKLTNQENVDFQAAKKVIWKTITQPTALTQCVLDTLCREVGDDSWRGLYRIKWCTMPPRKYGLVGDQPVESIEEIIDEVSNICTNLQYTDTHEYNKTKDALDHQMMRVKFGKKFSFTLNVWFKPVFNMVDSAHQKRLLKDNNAYLENLLLGITDELTFREERNKYVHLYHPLDIGINSTQQALALQKSEEQALDSSEEFEKRDERSQELYYAEFLEMYADFTDYNMALRKSINGYTQGMKSAWENEKKTGNRK